GRAEHGEVGRNLERDHLGSPRIVGRTREHEQLPPAVRLCLLDESWAELKKGPEPAFSDGGNDLVLELPGTRTEAVRATRSVGVCLVRAGNQAHAQTGPIRRGSDHGPGGYVLGQRPVTRRSDDDRRAGWVAAATAGPQRDPGAPG